MHGGVERSLGFIAVQSRGGTITIPAEARRALRLDVPGAQVEVILRDHDLVLLPHVAVRLGRVRDHGTAPAPGGAWSAAAGRHRWPGTRTAAGGGHDRGPGPGRGQAPGQRAAGLPPGSPAAYRRP